MSRIARLRRQTSETEIALEIDLDGGGLYAIETGLGFLDHMLEQFAKHSQINLTLTAQGDLRIDPHHTAEDCGIVLGQAIDQALGKRQGITRFAHSYVAMDEALCRVCVDLSGRPYLVWRVDLPQRRIGDFDLETIQEWFQALAVHLRAAIHVECLYGHNTHHIVEACYKSLALALRAAIAIDPRLSQTIPSTKGTL